MVNVTSMAEEVLAPVMHKMDELDTTQERLANTTAVRDHRSASSSPSFFLG